MMTIIDNPAIRALYATQKPQPVTLDGEQVAGKIEPEFARAPAGAGHEAALQQKGVR